jgi:hypothetical protein
MSFATFDVRRVASTVALISLLGCGSEPAPEADAAADAGSTDSAVMNDAAVSMDTSVPMDAAPPFVFDGAVPENGAVVFADPMLGGSARLVTADVITLGDDADTISSLIVPAGYVLYGASDAAFGGDLSDRYEGPVTIDDLGALSDTWDSLVFRRADEPTAEVYRDVGANPKRYPLGTFPTLGATNDVIDGLRLPDGVTLVGFDDAAFGGTERGPYVGPLDTGALPYRDVWSSLRVRRTTGMDRAIGDVRLYQNGGFGGTMVVFTAGAYHDLNDLPGVGDYRNYFSSMRAQPGLAVFAFAYENYGGNVFGPYVGEISQISENDDWDSIIIQRTTEPTLSLFFDGNYTTEAMYPIIDVTRLQNNVNRVNGVRVPDGYVLQGFDASDYGGETGAAWIHTAGMSVTLSDRWDSFIVRRTTDPTVTLYFNAAMGDGRIYPLGDYRDINPVRNQIDGASVPCGVRIRAYQNPDYGGTEYVVTGPATLATVPGPNDWDSMHIERVPCTN